METLDFRTVCRSMMSTEASALLEYPNSPLLRGCFPFGYLGLQDIFCFVECEDSVRLGIKHSGDFFYQSFK